MTPTSSHSDSIVKNDNSDKIIQPQSWSPGATKSAKASAKITPRKILLIFAMLACAAGAWFLFTAKTLSITTTPATDNIQINGGLALKFGDSYLLRPGLYTIHAKSKDYQPLQQGFTVDSNTEQYRHFTLNRLPGLLTVNTLPKVDAEIWLDGVNIGRSDTQIKGVEAGQHQLTVSSKRYLSTKKKIHIEGLGIAQSVDISMQPAWGDITLGTLPSNADIYIDEQLQGKTPATVQLLEGERRVSLKIPGYQSWDEVLEIQAGDVLALDHIKLKKITGLTSIKSTPSGASITIDGQFYGHSPLDIPLEPKVNYRLSLLKDGYKARTKLFSVESGDKINIALKLKPDLGKVEISTTPEDALLYIDGRLLGRANQVLELPAKQHQIHIKKDGYIDHLSAIIPRPAVAQSISITLKTLEQAKWENTPAIITTKAGQKLKLFNPKVKFRMGASRREQGRRANENYRNIELQRPFYIGFNEVSNNQYRKFNRSHSSSHTKGSSLDGEKQPVVNISWQQAARYCNWLSEQEKLSPFYLVENDLITSINPQANGYRLPTEAEWAWAARWQDSGTMLKYPWGQNLPPQQASGNYADRSAASLLGSVQVNYNDGYAVTGPVGQFKANQQGLFDLGGNVAEWLNDFYGISSGLSLKTSIDPTGPKSGDHHVIRGSSWAHGTVKDLRLSFRDYGTDKRHDLGFRVARYVD